MTPEAKAVLASMTPECRKALDRFAMEPQRADASFPVQQVWLTEIGEWPGFPPMFVPSDSTAIVAEVARMVGADAWVWFEFDNDRSAWRCILRVRGAEVMDSEKDSALALALSLFKAAHDHITKAVDATA